MNSEPEPLDDPDEAPPEQLADLYDVRNVMLRIVELTRRKEEAQELRRRIVTRYDEEINRIDARIDEHRALVEAFIVNAHGGEPARIPDVGTAYIRELPPRIVVTDEDSFEKAAWERWADLTLRPPMFDLTAARKLALEEALSAGELLPGTSLETGRTSLTIKGTS
jgi:hypothetical protein